ncbi:MAG: S41 family peptidase [Phycisphaeraceae bacterium]
MNDRRQRWILVAAVGVCMLVGAIVPGPRAGADPGGATLDRMASLAESGRFLDLLEVLRERPEGPAARLVQALERYQANESRRMAERQELYEQAIEKMAGEAEAGRVEDALIAAIDAHRQAQDEATVLVDPAVVSLVERVEAAAGDAEAAEDWLGALTYYQLLDLLYENRRRYESELDRTRRHVRLIQVYAPEHFEALRAARREAREAALAEAEAEAAAEAGDDAAGDDADDSAADDLAADPIGQIDHEPWQERLEGVELRMFRQALRQTARRHISGGGFVPLMRGGVEQLQLLINTEALAEVFPGLADGQRVRDFRRELDTIAASLDEPGRELTVLQANRLLDRIDAANARTIELPEPVLAYELTEGATGTLDDFSSVIWPREQERFTRSLEGRFFGVGIHLSRREGRLIVISPLPNTPAQRAGIKAGDAIVEVDGQDTSTWSLDRAVRHITGPEGSKVRLTLQREGETELIEQDVRRAEIPIESIRGWEYTSDNAWRWMIDPDERIGYVRLTQFIPQTATDLDEAIAEMRESGGLEGLILDLRSNPGGLLSAAIDVADRFVEQGPIVFTVDASGRRTYEGSARRDRTYRESFPVVVLINGSSASASEIVAGALQDYGLATIVGSRSFGKGSVQDPFTLDRGSAILKLTTQYYMLPAQRIIDRRPDAERWGIEPDLVVDMTRSQQHAAQEARLEADTLWDPAQREGHARAADLLEDGLDPQLEAALLLLQTRVIAGQMQVAQRPAE